MQSEYVLSFVLSECEKQQIRITLQNVYTWFLDTNTKRKAKHFYASWKKPTHFEYRSYAQEAFFLRYTR